MNGRCNNYDRSSGCRNEVTRTVSDGDQALDEIRALADTVGETSEHDNAVGAYVGAVGYTHAGGIDAPLGLFKGADTVWPLTDSRGQYDLGVCGAALCSSNYYFPGGPATAYGEQAVLPDGPPSWYGELIQGAADGSGLRYRRHRYYDPGSGQFTQEDPIGLAGGLNLYGFASGDPVSFSDPFGLCPVPQLCVVAAVALGSAIGAAAYQVYSNYQSGAGLGDGVVGAAAGGLRDGAVSGLVGAGLGAAVGRLGASSGVQMGTRYMGAAEAAAVGDGVIPATNKAGRARVIHYTTDSPTMSASAARARYNLPEMPTHMCRFPLCAVRDNVPPTGTVAPGATQAATSQAINGAGRPRPLRP